MNRQTFVLTAGCIITFAVLLPVGGLAKKKQPTQTNNTTVIEYFNYNYTPAVFESRVQPLPQKASDYPSTAAYLVEVSKTPSFSWVVQYVDPFLTILPKPAPAKVFCTSAFQGVYAYYTDPSGQETIIGLNANKQQISIRGISIRLWGAIAAITAPDSLEYEFAAIPQSDPYPLQLAPKGSNSLIDGTAYRTKRGVAFVSNKQFADADTGKVGRIVVFDTKIGKEQRLVSLGI